MIHIIEMNSQPELQTLTASHSRSGEESQHWFYQPPGSSYGTWWPLGDTQPIGLRDFAPYRPGDILPDGSRCVSCTPVEVASVTEEQAKAFFGDPSKYNFIFAETQLDAQNFWAQIGVDITARRKMSAKIMPNL